MAKSVSPDKGKTVQWYIDDKLVGWQQDAALTLHALVLENVEGATHGIKWGQAVYESPEGPAIFMKGNKNHLTFGFWRGTELEDPDGKLEGSGDRMRHLKIRSTEIDSGLIAGLIREAARLNKELGDPTKQS